MKNRKKLIIAVCITAVISSFVTASVKDIVQLKSPYGKTLNKIETISELAEKYYLNDIDYQKIENYTAYALTAALDDPYTTYYSSEQFKEFTDENNGVFVGVGIVVAPNVENDTLEIISPYEDSPAEKAGLMAGDVVVSMDGNLCNASNYSDVINMMRGKAGEKMTLTLLRNAEKFDVTLVREEIHRIAVKSRMLDNEIGYIRISDFDVGMDKDFKNQFEGLKKQGMQKLIIDLRNNPGGDADAVCSVADYLLSEGTIMYTMDKYGNRKDSNATDKVINSEGEEIDPQFSQNIPIAVLVNEGSASASEVLSGAIRCADRGKVIGTKTYGKGVIQSIIPFNDGSGLKMTFGKYYFADGKCIHGEGVKPDFEVTLPDGVHKSVMQLTEEEDTQLKAAEEFLKNN